MTCYELQIVLTTYRRRKIFRGEKLREECTSMIRTALETHGCTLSKLDYSEAGVLLELSAPLDLSPYGTAAMIANATSRPLRERFEEISKAPSVWTRDYLIHVGPPTKDSRDEANTKLTSALTNVPPAGH